MRTEKLVMMANQIAAFFAAQGEARAVPQIAKHIESFWDPRMRAAISSHVAAGGTGLEPLALTALMTVKGASRGTA
jgi:formate dehydrogenase subunit delta